MKAKLVIIVDEENNKVFKELAKAFHLLGVGGVVRRVHFSFPEVMVGDGEEVGVDELEGEVMDKNKHYILTYDDSIMGTMRVYEKLSN